MGPQLFTLTGFRSQFMTTNEIAFTSVPVCVRVCVCESVCVL